MKDWIVQIVTEAGEELRRAPAPIQEKFSLWVALVQVYGPRLAGGWRTESLKGFLAGFYSARLNRKWRVVFEVRTERKIVVIRIVAHNYKAVIRR